jgi:hypothetical protein
MTISEKTIYKVIVPNVFDSIPLTLTEAMEYASDINIECEIVNIETGNTIIMMEFA